MPPISLVCRTATPFKVDGTLDEAGLRQFLRRFIDNRIGVVLCSSGTGEGYALKSDEMRRVFEIGVEECRGKVPVYANPPEQHTARVANKLGGLAIKAGVDCLVVFPLAGWHGMKPSDTELRNYYDSVLGSINHPVALAVNSLVGYTPKISIIADVIRRHTHIRDIFLTGLPDSYFIALKPLVTRKVEYFAQLTGGLNMFTLGASGLFATEANVLPKSECSGSNRPTRARSRPRWRATPSNSSAAMSISPSRESIMRRPRSTPISSG